MSLVPASLFTDLINQFSEDVVTFHRDTAYDDEDASWTTPATFTFADAKYQQGAPEAKFIITVPADTGAFRLAAGQTMSVQGKSQTYTVVDVRPLLIMTSEPLQYQVGVKL